MINFNRWTMALGFGNERDPDYPKRRKCDEGDLNAIADEAQQRHRDDLMGALEPGQRIFQVITTSNMDEIREKAKKVAAVAEAVKAEPDRSAMREKWRQLKRELREFEKARKEKLTQEEPKNET